MPKVWNSNNSSANSGSNDDDEKSPVRTVIRLRDFNTTLSIWDIESIDKKERFIEHPRARWQFGIVINGGIEPSCRYPKVDIEAWFEREETRDERYERLLETLEEFGFKILDA